MNKESFNPLINALGVIAGAVVVYLSAEEFNTLPTDKKVILGLVGFAIVVGINYVIDYLKKKAGSDATTVLKDAKKFLNETPPQSLKVPQTPELPNDTIQTKYGVFERNRSIDPVGVYTGKADLGNGLCDYVYIDIEFYKAGGGKQIKVASIPTDMGLCPILSRFGLSTDGAYSKDGKMILGLIDDIFALPMAEEEKQRQLFKARVVEAYSRWKGTPAKEVTDSHYNEVILPEIAAAGITIEQLISLMITHR